MRFVHYSNILANQEPPKKSFSKKGYFFLAVFLILVSGWYYFYRQVYFSHGIGDIIQNFEIRDGEGVKEIAKRLENKKLIKGNWYFNYYVFRTGNWEKIQAGKYELRGSMTIPEIVQALSIGNVISNEVKVTFPEGIKAEKMEEILKNKGFAKNGFLEKVNCACGVKTDWEFLSDKPKEAGLEGYLFPDTYIFFREAGAEQILNRMLVNFDEKMRPDLRIEIKRQGKTIYDVITMASILEKEVKTPKDMKIVSGIFWSRIKNGQPLQSCATIAYVLGKEKKQYSYEDTRAPSPYNTYLNKGLPPGPINNPGMNAIEAAIYPTETDYNYFLSDPETGKTVFSKTIDEHEENKAKYGL